MIPLSGASSPKPKQIALGVIVPFAIVCVCGASAFVVGLVDLTGSYRHTETLGVGDGVTTNFSGDLTDGDTRPPSSLVYVAGGSEGLSSRHASVTVPITADGWTTTLGETDGVQRQWIANVSHLRLARLPNTVALWDPGLSGPEDSGRDAHDPRLTIVGGDDGRGSITGAKVSGTIDYTDAVVNLSFEEAPEPGQWLLVHWYADIGEADLVIGTLHEDGRVEVELPSPPPPGAEVQVEWTSPRSTTQRLAAMVALGCAIPLVAVFALAAWAVASKRHAMAVSMSISYAISQPVIGLIVFWLSLRGLIASI